MRVALGVEYDGSHYHGWQIQPDKPSVQEDIEQALSRIADKKIFQSQVAGRTDKGVHATEQIMHFDTDVYRDEKAWLAGTNRFLNKHHVSIIWAKHVPDNFHARFSAIRRRYRYILFNRPIRPSFLSHLVSWEPRPLDLARMQEAATYLEGEHDFDAYRTVHCQAHSPIKTLYEIKVSQQGHYFYFDLEANSFLHHMVRNIVGVLSEIGQGEQEPIWAKEVLDTKDRTQAAKMSSAFGLYLTKVSYDDDYGFPQSNISEVDMAESNINLPNFIG